MCVLHPTSHLIFSRNSSAKSSMPNLTYSCCNRGSSSRSYSILEELEPTRVSVYCQALTLWLPKYFDGGLAPSNRPSMHIKGIVLLLLLYTANLHHPVLTFKQTIHSSDGYISTDIQYLVCSRAIPFLLACCVSPAVIAGVQ